MKKILSSTIATVVIVGSVPIELFANSVVQDNINSINKKIQIEKTLEAKSGDLEVYINFDLPIKNVDVNQNNMKLDLKKDNTVIAEIPLGSESLTSSFEYQNKSYKYDIERLNFARNQEVEKNQKLYYYKVTIKDLPCNLDDSYNLVLSGNGFKNAVVENIVLNDYSKRIFLGNTISEKEKEKNGAILFGDINKDGKVNQVDYDIVLENVSLNKLEYDLNRDGKVTITDLSYIKKNMNKIQGKAIVEDTAPIIDLNTAKVETTTQMVGGKVPVEGQSIVGSPKELLTDEGVVQVSMPVGKEISEETPAMISLDLGSGSRNNAVTMEQIVIKGGDNGPKKGIVSVDGVEYPYNLQDKIGAKNARYKANSQDIVIDLGKQISVSQITISITETTQNDRNLAEIAKIEFLNNVYKELPKPEMNIPQIKEIKTYTPVGNEKMEVFWNYENNVTGYEIKLEEIDEKGNINGNPRIFKTTTNNLTIRDIKAYARYRVSIQSLNGEWIGGYKVATDEDIDGIPENIDPDTIASGQYVPTQFSPDGIVEIMVVPETKPEPPEGISIKGRYKSLEVNWKKHNSAQSFDVYYRQQGMRSEYIKANKDPIKNATNYTIGELEDGKTYEVKMTATNHLGTSGLSKGYIGATSSIQVPNSPNYNLINLPNGVNELTKHIEKVEFPKSADNGHIDIFDEDSVVDNDYSTAWTIDDWDAGQYSKRGPIITFDKEYTIDTVALISRLDNLGASPYMANIGIYNEETEKWEYKQATVQNLNNNGRYTLLKLDEPITGKKIQINPSVYGGNKLSISELKFYNYDGIEKDIKNLFKDDLQIELRTSTPVTQQEIDELKNRLNTKDPNTDEYHPQKDTLLKELKIAEDILQDKNISEKVIEIDPNINNAGTNIGYSNDWQSLGYSVKSGDTINIYLATNEPNREINLAYEQHYGESGAFLSKERIVLKPGKNTIQIDKLQDLNVEKGGNLYVKFPYSGDFNTKIKIRVSGAEEIPHLNLNNLLEDVNYLANNSGNNSDEKVKVVKDKIRDYILYLKNHVDKLPSMYPSTVSEDDMNNNIYTYDEKTSVLNSTNIEGDRFTLTLPATQVYKGISKGIEGNIEAQVDRMYNNVLAWEQMIQITNAKKGVYENEYVAGDLNNDGVIDNKDRDYYNKNRAPKNRVNIKYQRMFIGAFMYASGHHVGIEYGSSGEMLGGVPYKFDENGKITNADEAQLFGWGIGHEIGHKADIAKRTYSETTNNILALIAQTFDDKDSSRLEENGYENIYDKVTSGSVGVSQDVFVRLGMFWQLHLAYENNYTYEMLKNNNDAEPSNDSYFAKMNRAYRDTNAETNDKDQLLIRRASDAAGKDLRGFFASWGLVADESTRIYLQQKFPNPEDKETKKIQYLNDNARRKRLEANEINNQSLITMEEGTEVVANFDDGIQPNSVVNGNSIKINLNVNKGHEKILGYEIVRSDGNYHDSSDNLTKVKYRPVGFVEAGSDGSAVFEDSIAPINNRVLDYKIIAYDYNLNPTNEFELGAIKLSHDGTLNTDKYSFKTNTISDEDKHDENNSHGPIQHQAINNIKDNDDSTIYKGRKMTKVEYDKDNHKDPDINISEDPYVVVDMNESKNIVGLKYTKPQDIVKKFSLKGLFSKNKSSETVYNSIDRYEIYVSNDNKNWTKAAQGNFKFGQETLGGNKDAENVARVMFNDKVDGSGDKLWAYDAKYVKLVAKGATNISIADLNLIGPTGDNIEIGAVDKNNQQRTNGIGKLAHDYVVQADGEKVIPEGSIIITGEYKGDPAFNVPLLVDENNKTISGNVVLLADIPDNGKLGEVSDGKWIYWLQEGDFNKLTSKVKSELYRYNEAKPSKDENGNDILVPVGQRLVSDTLYVDIPKGENGELAYENLPNITLSSETRIKKQKVHAVHINNQKTEAVLKNR